MIPSHGRAQYAYINRFSHRNNKSKMSSAIMIYVGQWFLYAIYLQIRKKNLPSFLYLCVYFSPTKLVHTAWDLCVESLQEIILTPLYIICIVCISFIQHKNNKNSSVKHQMDQIALYGYFCAFQLKTLEEEEEEEEKMNCFKK